MSSIEFWVGNHDELRRCRWVPSWAWTAMLLSVGCNSLLGVERLPEQPECNFALATGIAVGEESGPPVLSESAVQLSTVFPSRSSTCEECIRQQCGLQLSDCENDPLGNCVSFSDCTWGGNVTPTQQLRCERDFFPSTPAERNLYTCWRNGCVEACQVGTNWDCAGGYANSAPQTRGAIEVTQVLQRSGGAAISGAEVRFCENPTSSAECRANPDGWLVTNSDGVGCTELPLPTDGRGGWLGYRLIDHEDIFPARLRSNRLYPVDGLMQQQVLARSEVAGLLVAVGADRTLGNVLFQVFDCANTPAEGVTIDIEPQTPGAEIPTLESRIGYVPDRTSRLPLEADATRSEGGGSGVILNLQPDVWMWVTARLPGNASPLARVLVRPAAEELLMLEIHPDPS